MPRVCLHLGKATEHLWTRIGAFPTCSAARRPTCGYMPCELCARCALTARKAPAQLPAEVCSPEIYVAVLRTALSLTRHEAHGEVQDPRQDRVRAFKARAGHLGLDSRVKRPHRHLRHADVRVSAARPPGGALL